MYKRLGDGLFGEVGKDIVVSCCWSPDDILRFSLSSVRSDGGFLLRKKWDEVIRLSSWNLN